MASPETWAPIRTPDEMAKRLRAIGQRATPQRLLILGAFAKPGEHLTAEEVYERVGPLAPAVNRSTVYRTLELFRDLGLVTETDLGGGVRHFEIFDESRHHHLICRRCGHMLELADEIVAPLRERVRDRYDFDVTADHLALFGWCSHCRAEAERSPSSELETR